MPAFAEILGRDPEVMAKAFADPEWRARARAQTVAIADQTDFLDGDIEGYFRRTSVEETDHHADLRGVPLATVAEQRGVIRST